MPRTRLLAFAPVGLLAALVFVSPARASLVQNMQTINHDGQTFLTWDNLPGTGWKYRVYRALVPITSTDAMLDAELLGCVGDSSAVDWRLSNVLGSRFTFRIVEGAPELDASRGLFVYTPDEGSLAYYCVTAELSGQGEDWRGVPGKNATTEPIFEGVGRPLPIHQRTLSIVQGGEDYVLFLSNRKATSFPAMCSQ